MSTPAPPSAAPPCWPPPLVVTGCGSDAGDGDRRRRGRRQHRSGAFPVTVSTAFGDVTVEEEPTRVVALGWSDAETALALGVQPVGASDWLAFGGDAASARGSRTATTRRRRSSRRWSPASRRSRPSSPT